MSVLVGITAEFNPFHNGHAYLIKRIKETFGDDCTVISAMSGDFVQRGEPAVFNKHARAEAAVRCGVNAVFEIPFPWCSMSAEGFASAGVSVLAAAGCKNVAFGAENDNIFIIKDIADALCSNEVTEKIITLQRSRPELSFASARDIILEDCIPEASKVLSQPNNTLAVEYIKAINRNGFEISPCCIGRIGSGHDSTQPVGNIASASYLRAVLNHNEDVSEFIPMPSVKIVTSEAESGRGPVTPENLEQALLSRLRMLTEKDFISIPYSNDGAGERLARCVRECCSIDEICERASTKRLTKARFRRMILFAALSIDKDAVNEAPPYLRLLAADEKGCSAVRAAGSGYIPFISKPASVKKLDSVCRKYFELNSDARDLYTLAYTNKSQRIAGSDFRCSPTIINRK